jgi:hypothetical protein
VTAGKTIVRPEQFEITNEGITHKPTGYRFTAYPGQPLSGNLNEGQLGNVLPSGEDYRPHEVKEMARQLWTEYVHKGHLERE